MHKRIHCVLIYKEKKIKINHPPQAWEGLIRRKPPTGALRVPTREQKRDEVQQAGSCSSQPFPAHAVR